MKDIQCPNCGAGLLQLRDVAEDDELEILECGVCGYAEFKIEGDGFSFGGSGAIPSELQNSPRVRRLREQHRGYGPSPSDKERVHGYGPDKSR